MSADIKIPDNTQKTSEEFKRALLRGMWSVGETAERYAKLDCPVDTGRLRNSITHVEDENEQAVYIGTNVEYAPFIELGTSRMRARPFLEPAATQHGDEYKKILESSLKAGD